MIPDRFAFLLDYTDSETVRVLLKAGLDQLPETDIGIHIAEMIQGSSDLWSKSTINLGLSLLKEEVNAGCSDPVRSASVHYMIGEFLWNLAYDFQVDSAVNYECAIDAFQISLNYYSVKVQPEKWACVNQALGHIYLERIQGNRAENINQAIRSLKSTLQVYSQERSPDAWVVTMSTLANAYACNGEGDPAENLEKAIRYLEQAADVLETFPNRERWASIQVNLGIACQHRPRGDAGENLEQSIQHLRNALTVFGMTDYPQKSAMLNTNLGNAFSRRIYGDKSENQEKSIQHFRTALQAMPNREPVMFYAMILRNLSSVYKTRISGRQRENIESALTCCNEALELCGNNYPLKTAMIHAMLANLHQERSVGNRRCNLLSAQQHYEAALEVFTVESMPWENLENNLELCRTVRELNQSDVVENALLEAMTSFEHLYCQTITKEGRNLTLEKGAPAFYLAAYCAAETGNPEVGFEYLERGKTRVLSEVLAADCAALENVSSVLQKEYESSIREIKRLHYSQQDDNLSKTEFLSITAELKSCNTQLTTLLETIRAQSPDFMQKTPAIQEILTLLPSPDTALISFCVTDFGTAVFLVNQGVSKNGISAYIVPEFTTADLNRIKSGWLSGYKSFKTSKGDKEAIRCWENTVEGILEEIYNQIFKPVELELRDTSVDHIIFSPHKILHVLPLHLMKLKGSKHPERLFERFRISYTPSVSVLYRMCDVPVELRHSLLAVANPTLDLKYSESEVSSIRTLFVDSEVLSRGEAVRENVIKKSGSAGYLHFACHALFDLNDPDASGLILAGPPTGKPVSEPCADSVAARSIYAAVETPHDSGCILSLREISHKLDLKQTRLVVLSACESGLISPQGDADECVGLPAGFIQAGAKMILSTLWQADDKKTRELITHFYENLLTRDLPPIEALRHAQLEMLESGVPVYYWGGFTITGA